MEKSFGYCTCIKLWGILWNCISSASRIWFYLGVYVELRPVTRAYTMFTVTPMSLFMDRNWTINFIFLFYSIHYWTLEIQQMPFSVVIKLWIFYSLSSYFLKSKGERKGKKKKKKYTANWKSNYDNYIAVWSNNLPNCLITCPTFILEWGPETFRSL